MEAPDVPLPRKTIPGSIGCMSAFLLALALIGVAVAYFYSISDYSTELNVDGTYHFSGTLAGVKKVLFADRYKLVIKAADGKRLTLPPLPSPEFGGKKLFRTIQTGLCVDGDLTSQKGFLHDLSIKLGAQLFHFDTDAGWLEVAPPPAAPAPAR
jgi:hypothetical protein